MKTPEGYARKYRVVDQNGNISTQCASPVSAKRHCNSMNGFSELNDQAFFKVIRVFVKKPSENNK